MAWKLYIQNYTSQHSSFSCYFSLLTYMYIPTLQRTQIRLIRILDTYMQLVTTFSHVFLSLEKGQLCNNLKLNFHSSRANCRVQFTVHGKVDTFYLQSQICLYFLKNSQVFQHYLNKMKSTNDYFLSNMSSLIEQILTFPA